MSEIVPDRLAGLTIINDEADEKVGFEVPYAPRMDHRAAAWLSATTVIHASLNETYRDSGVRFMAAADNANLQLVQAPFDGRRSIMTIAPTESGELIKLPAFAFYELLRLLGDRTGRVIEGIDRLFPATDLYHLATIAETHAAVLLTSYPDPDRPDRPPHAIEYRLDGLPWNLVNIALFADRPDPLECVHSGGRISLQPVPGARTGRTPGDPAGAGGRAHPADCPERANHRWPVCRDADHRAVRDALPLDHAREFGYSRGAGLADGRSPRGPDHPALGTLSGTVVLELRGLPDGRGRAG